MLRTTMCTSTSKRAVAPRPSGYIVGPTYDWLLFLGPPVFALLAGIALSGTSIADDLWRFGEDDVTTTTLLAGVFVHAHLVIVFLRSHGNPAVRTMFPYRFLVVPPLLLVAMLIEPWVAVTASVLATFWDVYHSGAQTFGFGRIYDIRVGNDPHRGRTLDFVLNQLLYAGPILAGVTMMDHVGDFNEYAEVGSAFFTSIPARAEGVQAQYAWLLIVGGTAFVVYYVFASIRLHRSGRPVPWQKTWLLASTGLVSIYTWGFNSWGEAFLIMNLFHGLQYFGIVWATEHRNLRRMFRLEKVGLGRPLTWLLFVGLATSYGLAVERWGGHVHTWWAFTIVVSLMHFWYDAFIWSVRRR
jgi:hypothetical protein